ncbi:MAG: polyprenyl synthetase family protein [Dysgonamonadaceae bacterium]|jgi:geranylgeranyl diphosphate synthase type II|nr:polyprenyl synthetase family protein [Dysgonamonadaceae bacterium]
MISVNDALGIVEREIRSIRYPENPAGLYAPVAYLLSMNGKKIRPALTLLACNLWSDDLSGAIYPALAWETFHNFTLMHDDLMDRADIRRGQPAVHRRWNDNTAILSGDAMLILAYRLIAKSSATLMPALLDLFSKTAAEICEGQQYDMEFESRTDISEREYIDMICLKTAVLLGACLGSGAIVGGGSEDDCKKLYQFGINLGIAFQIRDDLLDVYGNPDKFGKRIGGDILCDKKTFMLVNALNRAEAGDREILLSWLGKTNDAENKIACFRQAYDRLNIKEIAERTISEYYGAALGYFHQVSVSDGKKKILLEFASEMMKRES